MSDALDSLRIPEHLERKAKGEKELLRLLDISRRGAENQTTGWFLGALCGAFVAFVAWFFAPLFGVWGSGWYFVIAGIALALVGFLVGLNFYRPKIKRQGDHAYDLLINQVAYCKEDRKTLRGIRSREPSRYHEITRLMDEAEVLLLVDTKF